MVRKSVREGARFAYAALGLAVVAALGTWLASLGSSSGWWSIDGALAALPVFLGVALIATGLGLFSRFRRRDGQIVAVGATLLGLCVAGFLVGERIRWDSHPTLHDVSTDLDDPPAFAATPIRRDLLAGVPVLDRPGYAALSERERWKAVHAEAYPDLRTLRLGWKPAEVIRRAQAAAEQLGWEVVRADPAAGRLEAVATSRFLGFKDDVSVRARANAEGGSIVDVRSVSRQGLSDHGRGARHIRRLSLALEPAH